MDDKITNSEHNYYNNDLEHFMNRSNVKYTIFAIVLGVLFFIGSLLLYPDWLLNIRALISLMIIVGVGVLSVLANIKQIFEKEGNKSKEFKNKVNSTTHIQRRKINTDGGTYIEGDVEVKNGDFIGHDKKRKDR